MELDVLGGFTWFDNWGLYIILGDTVVEECSPGHEL